MGKSIKSKYMKRKRMVKRERAGLLVETPRLHANKKKLDLLCEGHADPSVLYEPVKKNAFKYIGKKFQKMKEIGKKSKWNKICKTLSTFWFCFSCFQREPRLRGLDQLADQSRWKQKKQNQNVELVLQILFLFQFSF